MSMITNLMETVGVVLEVLAPYLCVGFTLLWIAGVVAALVVSKGKK